MTTQLGWFTAGRGPGSRAMFERTLTAIDAGVLDARVQFVFMHRERGEGDGSDAFITLAESRGIPVLARSARAFREAHGGDIASNRDAYDAQVRQLLRPYAPGLCVLAGYLLILSEPMVSAYRFVNIHGALPQGPIGLWQAVIWGLIAGRAEETGAMAFSVTPDLDRGPPIAYCRFALRGPRFDGLWAAASNATVAQLREQDGENLPLFQAIRAEGISREPALLVETLRLVADGEVRLAGDTITDARGGTAEARDLTVQVNATLALDAAKAMEG
jgi:phosphoribosylglycinamide formyltransferase-1